MTDLAPEVRRAADSLLTVLRRVAGPVSGMVPLHEPAFDERDRQLVGECLEEGFVSYAGRHVAEFEAALAEAAACRHAVSVVNGTVALQLLMYAGGVGAGDEVLCPALTFVATANAIRHAGAQPHFVDCRKKDLCIDPDKLERYLDRIAEMRGGQCFNRATGARIAGIVPVHVFGLLADLRALLAVVRRWNIPVFEDSTEALGAGPLCSEGSVGGTVSFNGNKIITTGGGGAVLTNDDAFATRLRSLSTTAKRPHPWHFIHDELAFNFRLPALNAALGLGQLEKLPSLLARKARLAARYADAVEESGCWQGIGIDAGAKSNHWLNAVALAEADMDLLEACIAAANEAGYQCRPIWRPMHRLGHLADCPADDLSVTEEMAARVICLPSSAVLADV